VPRFLVTVVLLGLCSAFAGRAFGNDVLPRLFSNIPVDTNFLSIGYMRSEGNVSVDPSLALDVQASMDTWTLSYTRSFAAFGQSAQFTASLPYVDLSLSGLVGGALVTAQDDNVPDPKFRLAFNLYGAPALPLAEFAGYRERTIIGFNFEVTPPWGDYIETRRVNFGANRWSFSPQFGFGHQIGRFTVEGSLTGIFFTDNDDYLVDNTLKQKPISMVRGNLLYHFRRPGTWLGVSALYLRGGETTVNGTDRQDLQSNSRMGVALSVPFARRHNLLVRYSRGVTTRIGADFDNYGVQYTLRF